MRAERGLTQQQVAASIGIKQPSLGDIETGETKNPAALTLIKLARLFKVDPEHLLTGRGPQHTVDALTQEESELLLLFRALSEPGRAYLMARARTMHADEHRNRPSAPEEEAPPPAKPESAH